MKKETLEYFHGGRNAMREEVIISRERSGKSEYVCVSFPNEEPFYKGWARPIKRKEAITEGIVTIETQTPMPKHTGGKRPYIMVMQNRVDVIDSLSLGAAGLLFKILSGGYVEWHTGRVIERRSKKSMAIKQMCVKFGIKASVIKPLLNELSKSNAMTYDRSKRAYFVDRNLAKKGDGQK